MASSATATAAGTNTDGRMDAEATRAMAKALYEALLPAAEICTREMNAVSASQDALALKIDQLTAELERLSQMSHSVGLEAYTKKIQDARQRLNAINTTLNACEQRIARMTSEMKAKSPSTAGPLLEESPATDGPVVPEPVPQEEAKKEEAEAETKKEEEKETQQ